MRALIDYKEPNPTGFKQLATAIIDAVESKQVVGVFDIKDVEVIQELLNALDYVLTEEQFKALESELTALDQLATDIFKSL